MPKKTYTIINSDNLLELNKIAKKKNKNQYIPEDILKQLKGKIVIVSHQFPHNDVEQRLVLFAGEKFPTLLLDVDFKNMNKLTSLEHDVWGFRSIQ